MIEPVDHRIEVHLDKLLEARGITLVELSAQVGVTVANLSILKNGHARAVRFSTLTAICDTLDCQPGQLLSLQISSHPPHSRAMTHRERARKWPNRAASVDLKAHSIGARLGRIRVPAGWSADTGPTQPARFVHPRRAVRWICARPARRTPAVRDRERR